MSVEAELNGAVIRASPDYELVLFDRLEEEERRALAELRADPDFYGILRPTEGSHGTVKAVGRDTALLFLTLQQPGRLPVYARRQGKYAAEIAQLVLDGVLELQHEDRYVSGPGAVERLLGGRNEVGSERGRIASLSLEALRFASALSTADPLKLARALYEYNRVPFSPRQAGRFKTTSGVFDFLEIDSSGPGGWRRVSNGEEGWIAWSPQSSSVAERGLSSFWYKLYVSPTMEALPATVGPLFQTLSGGRSDQMKIGSGAAGLYRPDKIVAYFQSFEALAAAAERVKAEIDGTPAQGVPFSAAIDSGGLLSWGIDPPRQAQVTPWRGQESWRSWVTNRLGVGLGQAKQTEDAEITPWSFALERLRLEGIDVDSWTPETSIWNAFLSSTT